MQNGIFREELSAKTEVFFHKQCKKSVCIFSIGGLRIFPIESGRWCRRESAFKQVGTHRSVFMAATQSLCNVVLVNVDVYWVNESQNEKTFSTSPNWAATELETHRTNQPYEYLHFTVIYPYSQFLCEWIISIVLEHVTSLKYLCFYVHLHSYFFTLLWHFVWNSNRFCELIIVAWTSIRGQCKFLNKISSNFVSSKVRWKSNRKMSILNETHWRKGLSILSE